MARNSVAIYRPWAPGSVLSAVVSTLFRPAIRQLTKMMVRRAAQTTVFEVVATFREAQTSEAKDKVFAIVSLMTFVGLKVPDDLQIDCELDTSEVYFRLSKNQILHRKGDPEAYEPLAPLRFAREKNKSKIKPKNLKAKPLDLPSWAVDWTNYTWSDQYVNQGTFVRNMSPEMAPWLNLEAKPEVQGYEPKEDEPTRLVSATRYNATKGIVGANPSIQGRVLTVSGIAVGRVTEVFDLAESAEAWKLAWTWPERGASGRDGTTPAIRDRRAVVLRTLCADMLGPRDWAAEMEAAWLGLGTAFEIALEHVEEPVSFAFLVNEVREMMKWRAEQGGWTDDNAAVFNASGFLKQVKSMLVYMEIMSFGNSLFVTDGGRLGLGGRNISVQEQDQVYVLYQGRTPFVLRPRQMDESTPRFQLVSECFVDGLMQGEAAALGGDLQSIEID